MMKQHEVPCILANCKRDLLTSTNIWGFMGSFSVSSPNRTPSEYSKSTKSGHINTTQIDSDPYHPISLTIGQGNHADPGQAVSTCQHSSFQ